MKLNNKVRSKLSELLTADCYKGYELQLERLAKKLSLSLFGAEFDNPDMSGAIYRDEESGKFNIYVNKRYPIERKRYIIAHEIGHYISALADSYSHKQLFQSNLGFEDFAVSYKRNGAGDKAEKEASFIALEMLMPKEWINRFIQDGLSIPQMAKAFFITEHAVTLRLNSMGIDFL